mmetsp:Transcript_37371/g.78364  ORF Transcript_37371/g.78364 Transcript_37371/m.78364 type:complete len:425 (-) Transcript_37371:279-1553(-)|eukprot:CAMPEP_0201146430 /NCGR_PEP_ID=MMETSP0851-20130426/8118_1 /ASSEMBLY_ACC=CAM_ASM_000631 /TAXON_ID=183588 /ORGANISM="Pseudo-nitzschia fraudulenta, Strain WWA7" /LENGTH=424 /DNA_ID=CAMNT_0047421975 /DNA_START=57 /DNA_END=1334 /DNA_ORIENTATION=-
MKHSPVIVGLGLWLVCTATMASAFQQHPSHQQRTKPPAKGPSSQPNNGIRGLRLGLGFNRENESFGDRTGAFSRRRPKRNKQQERQRKQQAAPTQKAPGRRPEGGSQRTQLFASAATGDDTTDGVPTEALQGNVRIKLGLNTLLRVGVPTVLAGIAAFFAFPSLSLWLCSLFTDQGVFAVLSQDSSQFVQNFLSVSSLLFSILVGQTYYFMYQQQEMVYYALFDEVTEAKSLLEQVALVSQGRSMYQRVLSCMSTYVQSDLKALEKDPAILLSSRPMDDPLETIMYLTSVGVPSTVYETVKSLRQARARRLGALQRKLPTIHMVMLWVLAGLELVSFPLLGAGTQTIGGYNLLTIEGLLFGVMTSGIVLTLRVVGELWRPAGGAYNVDGVLKVMVRGLERELEARTNGVAIKAQKGNFPSSSSS